MDSPCKFTNLNTPIINLIKCLLVAASYTLAAPVFADAKQDLLDTCLGNYFANDFDSALPSCIKAAKQGVANAQFLLGVMHFNGEATPKDDKQAIYRYTKASEQGIADAQFNVGEMHYKGEGTPKDYKQAFYWFTKAAEQGTVDSQYNLGAMSANGRGTPKNNVLAYVWWNIAAAQGNKSAEKNRGIIEGIMTPDQIAEAQKLSKEYYAKYVK
jgi:TPR repeat protein